jgi:2-iminobutanoate/2-iminopropanoate deaminase
MEREIMRVEPLSTFLERWKAPTSVVTRHGDTVYVSGLPPFDPDTGEVANAPIERQTELVLEQMKAVPGEGRLVAEQGLEVHSVLHLGGEVCCHNVVYARYFPIDPPARVFVNVPAWPSNFDIEVDCIAAI